MFTISKPQKSFWADLKTALFLVTLAVVTAFVPHVASGKVIGIVADDSGSMRGKQYLPGFGAQVLAAAIDGRAGQDRLFFMKLNDVSTTGQATPGNLGTQGTKAATIRNLATLFHAPSSNQGTPYQAVDIMLQRLAAEARPGETAHLILLTDGAFSNQPPKAQLRSTYERIRGGLKGPLKVDFIAIFPNNSTARAEFQAEIAGQGVKDAILSVFNGSENEGYWPVEGPDDLWKALRSIISTISDTDPAASARYVSNTGNQIVIDSPFSIERIVVTSSKDTRTGAAPRYQGGEIDAFNPDRETYPVAMPRPDPDLGNVRMEGESTVFRFANGLRPGRYTLNFTGPTEGDVFLLFDIKSTTVLSVLDENGMEPPRNGSGAYILIKDKPYTFVARIADPLVPGGFIDFSQIDPNTSFELFISQAGAGGGQPVSMDKDNGSNAARAAFTPSQNGLFGASALTRMPGFATPQSEEVRFEVLDTVASITLSPFDPAETCTSCGPSEVQSSITPNSPDMQVGTFTVDVAASLDGAIQFKADDFADFLYLLDDAGNRIPFDEDIPLDAGGNLNVTVMRSGVIDPTSLQAGPAGLSLSVVPSGGWLGDAAQLERTVKLQVPQLIMELISHSSDPSAGSGPLQLDDRALLRGQLEGVFRFREMITVFDPATSQNDFSFSTEGILAPLLRYEVITSPPGSTNVTAQVRPSTQFWCLCFFGLSNVFFSDQRDVIVSFEDPGGLQQAQARLPMQITVSGQTFALSCLWDLCLLFLLYVFIGGVSGWMRTRRFPKNAVAIIKQGKNVPSIEHLRGRNLTWLRCWLTFLWGPPHERATHVAGMELEASISGPVLILGKGADAPLWKSDFYGQDLKDIILPSSQRHQFSWGETLTDLTDPRLTVKFVADMDNED